MLYLAISFLILIIFIIIMLFVKTSIGIEYIRSGNEDMLSISTFLLSGIINLKVDIPLSKFGMEKSKLRFQKKSEFGKKKSRIDNDDKEFNVKNLYNKITNLINLSKNHQSFIGNLREYMSGRVKLKQIDLDIEFGAGEAFYTALVIGLIWASYGLVESYLFNNYKNLNNEVNILANFDEKSLLIDIYCIFSCKFANIITIGFKILKHYIKSKYKSKKMIGADAYG